MLQHLRFGSHAFKSSSLPQQDTPVKPRVLQAMNSFRVKKKKKPSMNEVFLFTLIFIQEQD